MTDLRKTLAPKSDQINADDLIAGPLTIKVAKVSLLDGDQPVAINYEGDGGKPYKPCKSMRRVLVKCWGPDGNAYIGRSLTLYRDDKVQFGGMAVGGIRISHMSHLDKEVTMALTATRASRKPFTVKPLAAPAADDDAKGRAERLIAALEGAKDGAALNTILERAQTLRDSLKASDADLSDRVEAAVEAACLRFPKEAAA